MTSRVLASPRAARSWHLELAQSALTLLPTFPERAGIRPGFFLLSTGDRGCYGPCKFYPKKPQTPQHVASQAPLSELPKAQSFIHVFFSQGMFCCCYGPGIRGHTAGYISEENKDPLPFWRLHPSTQREAINGRKNKKII